MGRAILRVSFYVSLYAAQAQWVHMAVIKSASDALMQQRHILSLIGIRQWGQLGKAVVQVRSLVDRFAEDDKHIKSMQNEIQEVQAETNSVLIPPANPVVVDDEMCIKSVVK